MSQRIGPLKVERVPAAPVKLERLTQDAPVLRLSGVTVLQVPSGGEGGGGSAPETFQHIQTSASATWTVNHNLGRTPGITVLSPGGIEVIAEVLHASPNQAVIQFATPQAGRAIAR